MNCQEALNLLHEVIDKEASELNVDMVHEHLEKCRDCTGVFEVEQSITELIKAKMKNQSGTPTFDSLKLRVLAQLDSIDAEDC